MPNPLIRTTLDLHPELARNVGLVVAEYALLERGMWAIYALLPGVDSRQSLIAYYSLRSIRRRQTLVMEAAEYELNDVHYKALKKLWKRLSAAATRRTEIAHCQYLADDEQVMRLQLTDKTVQFVPLGAEFFDHTFKQYHDLGTDLVIFQARLAETMDRFLQVTSVIPPAPSLRTPTLPPGSPGPPTQREIDAHIDAMARLKIPETGSPYRHRQPPWRLRRKLWRLVHALRGD